jgi:hypothetical protein
MDVDWNAIHHGAQVSLLRDRYRHRADGFAGL